MEDVKKEDVKPRTIRISEDTFEQFKKIANESFGSQGQALTSLIQLYQLEKNKKGIQNRQVEIETFQAHMNALVELYVHSIQLSEDDELRIRGELGNLLESKDLLIMNLQKKQEELSTEVQFYREEYKIIYTENEKLLKEIAQLQSLFKEKENELDSMRSLNKNLAGAIAAMKEKLA